MIFLLKIFIYNFTDFYHLRSIIITYLTLFRWNNKAHSDIFLLDCALLFCLIGAKLFLRRRLNDYLVDFNWNIKGNHEIQ